MIIGNRVPYEFFGTSGVGESDVTIHAGSYHLALRDAGIEMANILTYSSILPINSREVDQPEIITHGEVMETIMAVASCGHGETATAGLIYGWLEHRSGQRLGGLVCEYHGSLAGADVEPHLQEMIKELHVNGYEHLALVGVRTMIRSVTPTKAYGTALAALGFTSYRVQVLDPTPTAGLE